MEDVAERRILEGEKDELLQEMEVMLEDLSTELQPSADHCDPFVNGKPLAE